MRCFNKGGFGIELRSPRKEELGLISNFSNGLARPMPLIGAWVQESNALTDLIGARGFIWLVAGSFPLFRRHIKGMHTIAAGGHFDDAGSGGDFEAFESPADLGQSAFESV